MKLIKLIFSIIIICPSIALGSSNIQTDIIWVGQRGNGNVIIHVSQVIDQEGCNSNQIEIAASNEYSKGILSIALAAYASSTKVYIKADGCFNGAATINSTGYIHMEPK